MEIFLARRANNSPGAVSVLLQGIVSPSPEGFNECIESQIGKKRLEELQSLDITKFLIAMMAEGKK